MVGEDVELVVQKLLGDVLFAEQAVEANPWISLCFDRDIRWRQLWHLIIQLSLLAFATAKARHPPHVVLVYLRCSHILMIDLIPRPAHQGLLLIHVAALVPLPRHSEAGHGLRRQLVRLVLAAARTLISFLKRYVGVAAIIGVRPRAQAGIAVSGVERIVPETELTWRRVRIVNQLSMLENRRSDREEE